MGLKTTQTFKCLEKKTLILGFEILDIFVCCTFLALTSLLFGEFRYKFFVTWVPTLLIAAGLRFGKTGKPDNYLLHLLRFYFTPGIFSAFSLATNKRKKKGTLKNE